jgi:DNA-binding response OmpR family regulator
MSLPGRGNRDCEKEVPFVVRIFKISRPVCGPLQAVRSGSVSSALRRVLVIDDQVDVRTMISIVLRIHDFDVVGVATEAAGLDEFDGTAFDVAIIDIFLGRDSGLDVIAKIRERAPGFPIVAISGVTALDFVAESPELSDVICLRKPFRPAELVRVTEVAIASRAVDVDPDKEKRPGEPGR